MKRVFISRSVGEESAFRQMLEVAGCTVHGQSLLDFLAVPFQFLAEPDWIFFYSTKAVNFFFSGLAEALPEEIRLAVIGESTAKAIPTKIHFIGNGKPEMTASSFLAKAKGKKVLFPRAKNSRMSVQKLLAGQIEAIDLVVYENVPKEDLNIPIVDVLVFTSPLNAQTYFQKYALRTDQKVIAIGQTTASALQQLGIQGVIVAAQPYEIDLAKAVIKACNF